MAKQNYIFEHWIKADDSADCDDCLVSTGDPTKNEKVVGMAFCCLIEAPSIGQAAGDYLRHIAARGSQALNPGG